MPVAGIKRSRRPRGSYSNLNNSRLCQHGKCRPAGCAQGRLDARRRRTLFAPPTRDAGWPSAQLVARLQRPATERRGSSARTPATRRSRSRRRAYAKRSRWRASRARRWRRTSTDRSIVTRQSWPENGYYGPGPFNNTTTWNNTGRPARSRTTSTSGAATKTPPNARVDAAHVRAADARAAQLELEANVVRAYIGLSQDFALLDIARDTLAQQQKIADLARRRLAGRPRHATRSEPGRNAAAGIRAPGRCLQRSDRARAQSARRARRQRVRARATRSRGRCFRWPSRSACRPRCPRN